MSVTELRRQDAEIAGPDLPRLRRWPAFLAVAVLAFLIGLAVPRGGHVLPARGSQPVVGAPSRTVSRAPEGLAQAMTLPGGWPRTEAGAVGAAAASTAVDSGPQIAAGDAQAHLSADPALGWEPGSRLMLRTVPLMFRVQTYTPDAASVDIWGIVVAATDPSSVQAASVGRAFYGTTRFNLIWKGGDWVVTGHTDLTSGPRLALGNVDFPTTSADTITTLGEFTPFVSMASTSQGK
jgi:hypothetical protein